MLIRLTCSHPGCGASFSVEEARAQSTVRCVQCGKATAVPATGTRRATASADGDGRIPPERPAPKTPLTRLGRFQVRQRLGAGAFGTVYRAHAPQLDREVALKVPNAGALDSPKRIERFLREARSAAQLRHPFIVPVFEAGQIDGHYYIASAFVEGKTLAAAIPEGGVDPRRAAGIVQQLADATAYAHDQRVVHRDIKPTNVILDKDDHPHLMDFGLAAREDEVEKLTHDGAVLGTPAYMPPEQAAGHTGEVKPAVDQYALGVVLYELLTGKVPFEGPPAVILHAVMTKEPIPVRALRPDVPRDLETICRKAMAKRPGDRYPTCGSLASDLRRWLDGEPIRARKQRISERLTRWVRREPLVAGLASLLLVLSVVSSVVIYGLYRDAKQAVRLIEEEKTNKARWAIVFKNQLLVYDEYLKRKRSEELVSVYLPTFKSSNGFVSNVAWSPDGTRVVHGGENGTIRVWGVDKGQEVLICKGHTGFVSSVAWSPDGKFIASGGADKKVRVWDAWKGHEVLTLEGHTGAIQGLSWSSHGMSIVSGSADKTVRIWDTQKGRVLLTIKEGAPGLSVIHGGS